MEPYIPLPITEAVERMIAEHRGLAFHRKRSASDARAALDAQADRTTLFLEAGGIVADREASDAVLKSPNFDADYNADDWRAHVPIAARDKWHMLTPDARAALFLSGHETARALVNYSNMMQEEISELKQVKSE